jgi:hypothetical protein
MWEFNDGGRADAGFKGEAGDCAVRSAAIVTGVPYHEVYQAINELSKCERPRGNKKRSNARTGVWPKTLGKFLEQHGFVWIPTMGIGTGCTVHLSSEQLPMGKLVVRVSRHFVAVVDGVIQDTSDCSRGGKRCVYGYWLQSKATP